MAKKKKKKKKTQGWASNSKALKELDGRIKELSDRIDPLRRDWEARLRKTGVFRKAQELQKSLNKQAEKARAKFHHAAGLATKADVERLARKLKSIFRNKTAA